MSQEDAPVTYALRLHDRARLDMDGVRQQLIERANIERGRRWQAEIMDVIATLATYPRRCPLARETAYFSRKSDSWHFSSPIAFCLRS